MLSARPRRVGARLHPTTRVVHNLKLILGLFHSIFSENRDGHESLKPQEHSCGEGGTSVLPACISESTAAFPLQPLPVVFIGVFFLTHGATQLAEGGLDTGIRIVSGT